MARESLTRRRERGQRIVAELKSLYPDAKTELDFGTPFQLVVATLLSAQATDVSVNAATPALFAAYPNAYAMAAATPEEVEPYIRTIGLFRTKARNTVATAKTIVERYEGEVPATLEELTTLPGVGRKTANVVLANAFGQATIAVDTHVGRVSRRLALTRNTDPDKVELDLQKTFPSEQWVFLHHALILHGRRICTARRPACEVCPLCPDCPSCGKVLEPRRPRSGTRRSARKTSTARRA